MYGQFDVNSTGRDSAPRCPQCHDGRLVERKNRKNGQRFYGCSSYPACKFAVASLDRLKPTVAERPDPAEAAPSAVPSNELAAAVRELASVIRDLIASLRSSSLARFPLLDGSPERKESAR